jgi:hypothetical protein
MDFHHLDPYKKDFSIGRNWSKSLDALKAELDKCILVCRNCHGEIHEGLIDLTALFPKASSPTELKRFHIDLGGGHAVLRRK